MTQANKVKEIRKLLNLTQEEFADGLDISQAALSYIEKGSTTMSLPVLSNMVNIYKVNPFFLIGESSDEPVFMQTKKQSLQEKELKSKLASVKKALAAIEKEVQKISVNL